MGPLSLQYYLSGELRNFISILVCIVCKCVTESLNASWDLQTCGWIYKCMIKIWPKMASSSLRGCDPSQIDFPVWAVLTSGSPIELRGLQWHPPVKGSLSRQTSLQQWQLNELTVVKTTAKITQPTISNFQRQNRDSTFMVTLMICWPLYLPYLAFTLILPYLYPRKFVIWWNHQSRHLILCVIMIMQKQKTNQKLDLIFAHR